LIKTQKPPNKTNQITYLLEAIPQSLFFFLMKYRIDEQESCAVWLSIVFIFDVLLGDKVVIVLSLANCVGWVQDPSKHETTSAVGVALLNVALCMAVLTHHRHAMATNVVLPNASMSIYLNPKTN
jgi:hypothetical protein